MKKVKLKPVPLHPKFDVRPVEGYESDNVVAVDIINPCRGGLGEGSYRFYFSKHEVFDPKSRVNGFVIEEWFTQEEIDMIHGEVVLAQLA